MRMRVVILLLLTLILPAHAAEPDLLEPDKAFRFSARVLGPDASEEQMRWLDDLQRMAVDAETALLARSHRRSADSTARMAELDLPTLVLHSLGDQMQEFAHSRKLAANIRGARLVALPSNNHIVLADEPAWPVFLREVTEFLAPDRAAATPPPADDVTAQLSPRELGILRLAAEGRDELLRRVAEIGELGSTPPNNSKIDAGTAVEDEIGDLLFACVALARLAR